jgi:hypothetical protein
MDFRNLVEKGADRPPLVTHDKEGAFNNTNPLILRQIMEKRQMPRYLIGWVQAFTTERTLVFSFEGKSEMPKSFTSSIPQ